MCLQRTREWYKRERERETDRDRETERDRKVTSDDTGTMAYKGNNLVKLYMPIGVVMGVTKM